MNEKNFCPGFVFVRTSHHKDSDSITDMHFDAAVYRIGDVDKDMENRLIWKLPHIIVEMKGKGSADPYCDDCSKDDILDSVSDIPVGARGQMLAYAALQMEHQPRNFAFSVGIYGQYARFYRSDSSSIVVSARFNIQEEPRTLVEFFLRYSALTPVQRGFDPTVVPATDKEKDLFNSQIKSYLKRVKDGKLRQHPDIHKDIGDEYFPVLRAQVNTDTDGDPRWYLICRLKSPSINYSPCGRFTRGFVAVPIVAPEPQAENLKEQTEKPAVLEGEEGKLYWLKDSWRPANGVAEFSIYQHLQAKSVTNLPKVICGGDVHYGGEVQQTENDLLLTNKRASKWRRKTANIRSMVHHRLVQELLIPLIHVKTATELVKGGRDVMVCK